MATGKFVGIGPSGALHLYDDNGHDDAHFAIERHHGKVAIKIHSGEFVGYDSPQRCCVGTLSSVDLEV